MTKSSDFGYPPRRGASKPRPELGHPADHGSVAGTAARAGSTPTLLTLHDHHLRDLIQAIPGLANEWADLSSVVAADLKQGKLAGLKRLQTSIIMSPGSFSDALERTGSAHLQQLGRWDEVHGSNATPETMLLTATEVFGKDVAGVYLDALIRVEASRSEHTASIGERTEDPTLVAGSADEIVSGGGGADPATSAAGVSIDPHEMLLSVERLIESAVALAADLRAAALMLESGTPPERQIASRLDGWSTDVRALLTASTETATDLPTLAARLTASIASNDEETRELEKLLEAATGLAETGMDNFAQVLLTAQGFSSLEELRTRLSHRGTPSLSVTSSESEASAPEILADGAGEVESQPSGVGSTLVDVGSVTELDPASSDVAGAEPAASDELIDSDVLGDAEEVSTSAMPTEVADEPNEQAAELTRAEVTQPGTAEAKDSSLTASTSAADEVDQDLTATFVRLISDQRDGLAVHFAEAHAANTHQIRALRFLTAAFNLDRSALESELMALIPDDYEIAELGADDSRTLLAASVRSGLTLGYPPTALAPLLDSADYAADDPHVDLLTVLTDLVQRGWTPDQEHGASPAADLPSQWSAVGVEAKQLLETLQVKRIKHHRSTKVLRHLVRADQPIGASLSALVRIASGPLADACNDAGWSAIEQVATDASNADRRWKMITAADRSVSSTQQLREEITAGARTTLDHAVADAADFLQKAVALRKRFLASANRTQVSISDTLTRLIERINTTPGPQSVGDASVARLVNWLSRRHDVVITALSLDVVLATALAPIFEIPRDEDERPVRTPGRDEVAQAIAGRPLLDVVRGYLSAGNITMAQDYASAHGSVSTELDDEIARASKAAAKTHADLVQNVERAASRLRALYLDDLARDITVALDAYREQPSGRLDLSTGPLASLAEKGNDRLAELRRALEVRARAVQSPNDRQRILDLIADEDEVLAIEFLTMAESGAPLPDVDASDHHDFGDFFPEVVEVASRASTAGQNAVDAVRKHLGADSAPADRQLSEGLKSWHGIRTNKQGPNRDDFRRAMADVLRMIGLVPRPDRRLKEVSKTTLSGYATFTVSASPIDMSYVPSFGTQAHEQYDVTLVWDTVSPMKLMSFIDERRHTNANIILYFGTLDTQQRLELRRHTAPGRGKGFSPLVIDEAVAGWLSTRREPAFRLTQRVTLPFTTLNPYTPFAGGEVPDEVFVGREEERQRIVSPTGSMFVYGGRQLGKSALLRRVERMFTEIDPLTNNGSVAVYIDLKAASIGEALDPSQLWPVVCARLKAAGIIPEKTGRDAGAEEISNLILRWLRADASNRMLLLLDESDNFLTADSKAGRSGSIGAFPTLQSLKAIMEASERRFKPVFAGLHQVQRFHDTSNTPIAHGGQDILIGPLRTHDARELVVEPLSGLGYEFESQEAVWRLLLFTNYQASLVQIVCEALTRHMQSRSMPSDGRRVVITSDDVDEIYSQREVKDLIAQRFRWTINLDSRYRLIALVVALRSLDSAPGTTFDAVDLHEECEMWWEAGFSRSTLSGKEFAQYLDEMIGLGVLHRRDDEFGLRSPTIIGLLGTRDGLKRELDDAASHLELELEYNPTMNRRVIGESADLGAPRSPLPDSDLALLTDLADNRPNVRLIIGTTALAIDRAASAVVQAADERSINVRSVDVADLDSAISGQRSRNSLFVIDMAADQTGVSLATVISTVQKRAGLHAVVIASPEQARSSRIDVSTVEVVRLRRWTVEGLRAWQDSPFSSPELRERLHETTSGWPRLVERCMELVSTGSAADDALSQVDQEVRELATSPSFFTDFGISASVAAGWAEWFCSTDGDGSVDLEPATYQDLETALQVESRELVEELTGVDVINEVDGGWVLNRATAVAIVARR